MCLLCHLSSPQPHQSLHPHPTRLLPCRLQLCSIHAKRVTIFVKDMQLARRLRGDRAADYE